ncbi:ImmA/IrrE family metallo-endopeptidase [Shouchella shacheensis]|uniref:ImmA/IrrE family metallo-endopeptidase n=1 Tax=Shouchella shacheensis TaxID=1649580 RepID=UPI0007403677
MKNTPKIKGLYSGKFIFINQITPTDVEKTCILAEELGHYYTTSGNILDQHSITNRKQEKRTHTWAYERLIPFSKIIQVHH